MNDKQHNELQDKLKENLQKILVGGLAEKTGFDKKTGLLKKTGNRCNVYKRFIGMPFVGDNYGKNGYPKILIVGSDIGSDECVDEEGNPNDGTNYFHTFETKKKACVHKTNKYNAHLAGTYMTALFLLKESDEKFKDMWSRVDENITAQRNQNKFTADDVALIASFIAFTNIHNFVTTGRKYKSGGEDRKHFENGELETFVDEVKCFAPDIIILQAINSIPENIYETIREIAPTYKLHHPSTRIKGGRVMKVMVINPLHSAGV